MRNLIRSILLLAISINALAQSKVRVLTLYGTLQGLDSAGIKSFKGVPYAEPPIGDLRWKEPRLPKHWSGVRPALAFASRAMQKPIYGDMVFRSPGVSEDCLYLNIWAPSHIGKEKLPVMIYFHGGGLMAGDGSELRYDGESMARKGMITVTINYRMGVFGTLALPEMESESHHHSAGNYGFLDQQAAIKWVKENIGAFGGNPDHIVIAGESAGSASVFAQMASPGSKNMIAGAIGESGAAIYPTMAPVSLAEGERRGQEFMKKIGANSLADLRAIPADRLLDLSYANGAANPPTVVDGYFWPKPPLKIYEDGEQAHVPLLIGWNSTESNYPGLLGKDSPTPENYKNAVQKLYRDSTDEVLQLYPGNTEEQVKISAAALASDRFIVYSTWKWATVQATTSGAPVYNYVFAHRRPEPVPNAPAAALPGGPPAFGALHASELEYVLGNLATNKVYNWNTTDYAVSKTAEAYFANFVKYLNPNGKGLMHWQPNTGKQSMKLLYIDAETHAEQAKDLARYQFLDRQYRKADSLK